MKHLTLTLTYLLFTLSCFSEDLIGKVVSVYDGDTITVLSGNTQHKIRLEGIDTPESKQPFGNKAKQAMSRMVFGKQVKVVWKKKDRYGRTLGHVYLNGKWTNLQMIKQGMAWHHKHYSRDQELAFAEVEARKKLHTPCRSRADLWQCVYDEINKRYQWSAVGKTILRPCHSAGPSKWHCPPCPTVD